MLSVSPDLFEPPEPINFEVEPGVLRDYEGKFPENDRSFKISMPPVEREEWIALLIKIFLAARGQQIFEIFFVKLIGHNAISLESIIAFLHPSFRLSEAEKKVFLHYYDSLKTHNRANPDHITHTLLRGIGIDPSKEGSYSYFIEKLKVLLDLNKIRSLTVEESNTPSIQALKSSLAQLDLPHRRRGKLSESEIRFNTCPLEKGFNN